MINSIGLQNIGVRAFVAEKLPRLAKLRTAVFANVFGYTRGGLRRRWCGCWKRPEDWPATS